MTPADLDTLADYVEGLLAGTPEGDAVAARIAADPTWADAYQQLTSANQEVIGALGGLANPPLPDEVATQLDRALAAEHRVNPTSTSGEAQDEHAAAWAKPAGHRPRRPNGHLADRAVRIGGWAAAAAVVALVAVTGLAALHSSSQQDDTASSDSAASAPERAPAVSGRSSGFPYTTTGLGPQARALLSATTRAAPAQTSSQAPEAAPAPTSVSALDRLTTPSALAACLTALRVASPLAVDYATLDGAPAVVLVTAGPGSTRLTVIAAGPNCGLNGAADQLARVVIGR